MTSQFPQFFDTRAFGRVLDSAFNDVVAAYGLTLELIFLPVLKALLAMEQLLLWLPWWAVLIGFSAFAWLASRSAKIMATVLDFASALTLGLIPNKMLTRDQVDSLGSDNVVNPGAKGFADLGIQPADMESVLPEYMWCYRPSGQYAAIKESAKNLRKA